MIVSARKPEFFQKSSPLYEIVTEDGLMRPCNEPKKGPFLSDLHNYFVVSQHYFKFNFYPEYWSYIREIVVLCRCIWSNLHNYFVLSQYYFKYNFILNTGLIPERLWFCVGVYGLNVIPAPMLDTYTNQPVLIVCFRFSITSLVI